jgi:hypothetical protein
MYKEAQKPLTFDEVCRRAGGRRRYNTQRCAEMFTQRIIIFGRIPRDSGCMERGWCAALAREFGVSRATISRDIWAVLDGPLMPLKRKR